MKVSSVRNIILLFSLIIVQLSIAQDKIVTFKSDTIEAKIQSINSKKVVYHRSNSLDGVEYHMSRYKIKDIILKNGQQLTRYVERKREYIAEKHNNAFYIDYGVLMYKGELSLAYQRLLGKNKAIGIMIPYRMKVSHIEFYGGYDNKDMYITYSSGLDFRYYFARRQYYSANIGVSSEIGERRHGLAQQRIYDANSQLYHISYVENYEPYFFVGPNLGFNVRLGDRFELAQEAYVGHIRMWDLWVQRYTLKAGINLRIGVKF